MPQTLPVILPRMLSKLQSVLAARPFVPGGPAAAGDLLAPAAPPENEFQKTRGPRVRGGAESQVPRQDSRAGQNPPSGILR